eukprot:c5372_g1_i1 orf=217-3513(+)
MSISVEQVELLLASTIGSDEASIRSATASLESAQSISGFPFVLLKLCAGPVEGGRRLAAATYLKNLLKTQWHQPDFMSPSEKPAFRNQLVDALLQSDFVVLKTLAEGFRFILDNDFVRTNTWPELVPAMKTALQTNLLNKAGSLEVRAYNVLVALQAMVKPFRYFMNPTLAREPVPEQLELISGELLVPSHQLVHMLVEEVKLSKEHGASSSDSSLLVLCKCFHLAVRSHMPSSLQPHLEKWCEDLFTLLGCVEVQYKMEAVEQLPRMKTWKRALQIFCTLVTRHRRYMDKLLPKLSSVLLDIVAKGAIAKDVHSMQERVISSAFDAISNILETGPGWRLISSHFSSLLEGAIFPALRLKEKDILEWKEDQEEYLRKNLPSDMDNTSGWRDDLYTPRRSALNLLGLISTSKGPPSPAVAKSVSSTKRKKAGKNGKNKEAQGTAGELLVVPFLSRFSLPPDGCPSISEPVINYYGALLAYGGLQQFLKAQRPDHLRMLLHNRVLSLYTMASPSPFLLANANWVLGQFASCLPEESSKEVYDSLLKAFLAPDVGDVTWRPVRTSAAAALSALLQEEFKPVEWLPLLEAAVTGGRSEDNDEASVALQVLATAADVGEEDLVPHLPAIISAVRAELYKRIPCIPEPWPQVVESGFSALAALAQTWDSAIPEEGGDVDIKISDGCIAIGSTISELLQQAWLMSAEDAGNPELSPPSSCLNDASALLVVMLKYAKEADLIVKWRIEEILRAWSDLIAEWSAWEEEEDLAVFDAIKEIVLLQGRFPLRQFTIAPIPPPPALPVQPRSILEGITTFISSGIETAYSAATWRACRLGHALLHVSRMSFESEEITPVLAVRFTRVAIQRFMQLSSSKVPLAKPLVLLIAMCYVCSPNAAAKALSEKEESRSPLLAWGEALADLTLSVEGPELALESELKLTVAVLLRMLEDLCNTNLIYDPRTRDLRHKSYLSLLTASIRLKELQDAEEESNDGDGTDSEEDEVDDTDEEDDESEDDEKLEETEDQFLERYAQKAQELEKEALDEAEGGEEEDGYELEIGVLGLTDQMPSVYACLQKYGNKLMSESPLPPEVVREFVENFPDSAQFFR